MDENKDRMKIEDYEAEEPSQSPSGWVMLYQIAGWVGLIAGLIFMLDNMMGFGNWAYGVSFILAAGSAFFAGHVLRLMEKAAHNLEQQTESQKTTNILLQKLVDKR